MVRGVLQGNARGRVEARNDRDESGNGRKTKGEVLKGINAIAHKWPRLSATRMSRGQSTIGELIKGYTSVHKNIHVFIQVYGTEFKDNLTRTSQ